MTWWEIGSAFWLGVLTAISPCPLAANITAISFIGRQLGNDRGVFLSGLLYTGGRVLAYLLLGIGITVGLTASDWVARFLQTYMNEILGPLLILLGMALLGMIGQGWALQAFDPDKMETRAAGKGIWIALPLGMVLAWSFCPVSAGLFFGGLIPLALKSGGVVLLPVLYGIGTALPVIVFAFLIAFGGEYLGRAFNCLTRLEQVVRRMTGGLLILAGVYYSLVYIYQIGSR